MAANGLSSKPDHHTATIDRFFQFSLLGLVASGYLAVAGSGYLDLATILVSGLVITAKSWLVFARREFPLSDRWVNGLTIGYVGFYALDYLFISQEFLAATVHLVLYLAVVKILTAKSGRDHLYVILVAFLEILAASLLSSSLNYFAFLALFLLFAAATFASWEIRRSSRGQRIVVRRADRVLSWRLAGLTAVISLGILLMTAGLFFVIPRTARAAFDRLVPDRFHLTAFSNEVALGEIGTVKQSSTVLMHVRIPDADGLIHLKWRGNALAEFDGHRWFSSHDGGITQRVRNGLISLASDEERRSPGPRLNYEVQLKSFASDTLFIAGSPEIVRIDSPFLIRTDEDGYRVGFRSGGVLRYGVLANPNPSPRRAAIGLLVLPGAERQKHLQLPELDPRIAQLARTVTAGLTDPGRRARAIETHLQRGYGYTIDLPDEQSADPIADFLFRRRRGHCEYFASAMAVMLRSVGIPSRVVTGFQSGTYNPISGWHVIRGSDAHSWVEAWLPTSGWTTFDPTPPDTSGSGPSLLAQLTLLFDAADTFWQEWVLEYDFNRQLLLAARVENSRRQFSLGSLRGVNEYLLERRDYTLAWLNAHGRALIAVILFAVALFLLIPRIKKWWSNREHTRRLGRGDAVASDATIMYEQALRMLRRRGLQRPAWVTPAEFAAQVSGDALAGVVARFTAAYNELRFGDRREAAPRMVDLLAELERHLKET